MDRMYRRVRYWFRLVKISRRMAKRDQSLGLMDAMAACSTKPGSIYHWALWIGNPKETKLPLRAR